MNVIDLVKNYLTYEGYQPEVDQDGDIHFRCQGLHLYCTNSGKDQQYLRLLLPNIYQVENNRTKVLEVSNQLSKEYKVLKSFLVRENKKAHSAELTPDCRSACAGCGVDNCPIREEKKHD